MVLVQDRILYDLHNTRELMIMQMREKREGKKKKANENRVSKQGGWRGAGGGQNLVHGRVSKQGGWRGAGGGQKQCPGSQVEGDRDAQDGATQEVVRNATGVAGVAPWEDGGNAADVGTLGGRRGRRRCRPLGGRRERRRCRPLGGR